MRKLSLLSLTSCKRFNFAWSEKEREVREKRGFRYKNIIQKNLYPSALRYNPLCWQIMEAGEDAKP